MKGGPWLPIALTGAMGVALIGFFAGTREAAYAPWRPAAAADDSRVEVSAAKTWAELSLHPNTVGSGWSEDVAALRGPSRLDPAAISGQKSDALAARARLRAYDGAPPAIPHPIRQGSASECLACHDEGLRLRGARAPAVPHDTFTSCTQCHVVTEAPMPGTVAEVDPRLGANSFAGMASDSAGPRAWSIGPPQIPHRTWMRESCLACHGPNGDSPMKSSHPERESCTQCHTASAEVDLRAGVVP